MSRFPVSSILRQLVSERSAILANRSESTLGGIGSRVQISDLFRDRIDCAIEPYNPRIEDSCEIVVLRLNERQCPRMIAGLDGSKIPALPLES